MDGLEQVDSKSSRASLAASLSAGRSRLLVFPARHCVGCLPALTKLSSDRILLHRICLLLGAKRTLLQTRRSAEVAPLIYPAASALEAGFTTTTTDGSGGTPRPPPPPPRTTS